MSKLPIMLACIITWSSTANANDIQLSKPSVAAISINIADFFPVGPNSPKTSDVFVIEFSSNKNLRNWSKQIDALILPSVQTCSDHRELDFEGYFIADSKGVIGVSGMIGQIPEMPLPKTAGRYTTFISRDQGKAKRGPYLEELPGSICMRVGVISADDLPQPWTNSLAISSDLLRTAWRDFVK